jgi:hypothetical protein
MSDKAGCALFAALLVLAAYFAIKLVMHFS